MSQQRERLPPARLKIFVAQGGPMSLTASIRILPINLLSSAFRVLLILIPFFARTRSLLTMILTAESDCSTLFAGLEVNPAKRAFVDRVKHVFHPRVESVDLSASKDSKVPYAIQGIKSIKFDCGLRPQCF
ncbi:hypothetical protein ARMGADRAFT_1077493 [Armillaria gallica]|uniref:Uncharacterized protein n=1 Tax=Armillaria gallica TaxID=47427 RepID=A0A2H3E8K1_ARMGA|nr:hypothetical protein ARMGADRAFT_1077493 [Armillaria gallica]